MMQPSPLPTLEARPEHTAPRCLNCAQPIEQAYCAHCGQATATTRLTSRGIVHAFVTGFAKLEGALAKTFLGLLRRPGPMIAGYIAGRRIGYMNPGRYFLLCVSVYLIIEALIESSLGNPLTDFSAMFGQIVLAVMLLGFAFPVAAVLKRMHGTQRLTVAECACFVLYLVSQAHLYLAVARVGAGLGWDHSLSGAEHFAVLGLVLFGLWVWAGPAVFSESRWRIGLKSLLAVAVGLAASALATACVLMALTYLERLV